MRLPNGRDILMMQDMQRGEIQNDTLGQLEQVCTNITCSDHNTIQLVGGINARSISNKQNQKISETQVADKIQAYAKQHPEIKNQAGYISIHALQMALGVPVDKKNKAIVGPITYMKLAEATKDHFSQIKAAIG